MNRHNLAYYFKEGVSNVFSHGFMSFASMSIMITCLILTGTVLILVLSLNQTISSLSTLGDLRAIVDERYTLEQAKAIEPKLRAVPNVSGVDFISNTRGLEEMRKDFGDDAWLLDGLEHDNPLRHCYRVWVVDIDHYSETITEIERVTGIAEVKSSQKSVDSLTRIRNVLYTVSIGFMAMLGTVAVFIISNTIKLATFDRREEIAIMKMIGATDGFIRAPFIIESLILSQLAAFIAFGMQWLVYNYVLSTGLSTINLVMIFDFYIYRYHFLIAYLAAAFIMGVLGSIISIRKFLRV